MVAVMLWQRFGLGIDKIFSVNLILLDFGQMLCTDELTFGQNDAGGDSLPAGTPTCYISKSISGPRARIVPGHANAE